MSTSIPVSTLEKFTTFGDLLRFLRRRVGITQMELSIAVGYSDAQISRLEQNLRLPDLPTIEARFISALGLGDEPKAVARLLELAANVRREDAPGLGLCPYKGLNYFDESDADLFVGREELTSRLTERVLLMTSSRLQPETRFLAVVGASGSGKSSLVRAGLVPALRWNKKSADWHIRILTPTARPLESLAGNLTLENRSVTTTATLIDDLARDPRCLHLFAKRKLGSENRAQLLLVVDQFEELFALCRSEEEKASFIDNLLTASSEPDGPIIVLITLRADFYAHCANHIHLREALARNQEYIGAMGEEELRRAIEEPAQRGRWELEVGLIDLLLHDVGHEPGALPLLSHALMETWQRRRGRMMTLSGYASSGGVRGAISETAEAVFADQFTREQQTIARRIFLRLTALGDENSAADTRRRATFDELILKPEDAIVTGTVLKALADARLIITSEDSAEVAHEALIREWTTLRGWLEENRESFRLRRQLTEAAQEWAVLEHSLDILFRGARLAQAAEWASTYEDEMNSLEREFLATSIEASERESAEREAQRQRELEAARKLAEAEKQRAELEGERAEEQVRAAGLLRRRALYMTGAFITALIMALTALFFGAQARQAAITAQANERIAFSRELAAAAISNLEVDPERSILLALEAAEATRTTDGVVLPEVADALHRALQRTRVKLTLKPAGAATFRPDGSRIATAGPDEIARVWDAENGRLILSLAGHSNKVMNTDFSPSGDRLVTTSLDGTARIWDLASGEVVLILEGHSEGLMSPVYSPDGTQIVTTSIDGTARLWNAQTGELEFILPHSGATLGPHFSPDGSMVAIADDAAAVARIWNTQTGEKVMELIGHTDGLNEVAFSPDGSQLVTASSDLTIKLWDAHSGAEFKTLEGHTGWVFTVEFSPDGRYVISGSQDGTARVWDVLSGNELITLAGHIGGVGEVSISPDGSLVVTSGEDGTARIWDITAEGSRDWLTLAGHDDVVLEAAISPNGNRIATASWDGTAKVWNLNSGELLLTLKEHKDQLGGVAFSPDGSLVATASYDGTARIWDAISGEGLVTLRGHEGFVTGVAFSPNGKLLATGGLDGIARLWNIKTGEELRLLMGHEDWVFRVAFSPDGAQLATASWDGTAKLWDAASGKELLTLSGHYGAVTGVSYSPDGEYIVTSSFDATVRIWKLDEVLDLPNDSESQPLQILIGHTGIVWGATFSPDGHTIASASFDNTVKLWDWMMGKEVLTLSAPSPIAFANVAFSSDGRILAASGGDGTVRMFLLPAEDLITLAQARVTRSLTTEECRQYLHVEQCPPEP